MVNQFQQIQPMPNAVEVIIGDTRYRATGQSANLFAVSFGIALGITAGVLIYKSNS